MEPTVRRVKAEGYKVRIVDVRTNASEAMKHRIRSIPTFVYVRGGEAGRRRGGGLSAEGLRDMCRGW